MEQALALYTGPYLDNFYLANHDDVMGWVVQEQRRFARQAFETAAQLTLYYYTLSNFESALRFAHAMLRIDPFNEEAHMALMRIYVEQGEKESAINHFQTYQSALSKEMEANPGQKIRTYYQTLYNQILVPEERRVKDEDFRLLYPDAAREEPEPGRQAAGPMRLSPNQPPFLLTELFGREGLLTELHKAVSAAENRLLSLTGLGGIGKTQVAIALGHRAATDFKDGIAYIPLSGIKRDSFEQAGGA